MVRLLIERSVSGWSIPSSRFRISNASSSCGCGTLVSPEVQMRLSDRRSEPGLDQRLIPELLFQLLLRTGEDVLVDQVERQVRRVHPGERSQGGCHPLLRVPVASMALGDPLGEILHQMAPHLLGVRRAQHPGLELHHRLEIRPRLFHQVALGGDPPGVHGHRPCKHRQQHNPRGRRDDSRRVAPHELPGTVGRRWGASQYRLVGEVPLYVGASNS